MEEHKTRLDLSLVVPCYNESATLVDKMTAVVEYMKTLPYHYELILVNDGSKDNTAAKILEIHELFPDVVKVSGYTENRGKGFAVRRGMAEASGENIFFMDADLSTKLDHIEEFMGLLQEHSVVIGSRKIPGCKIVKKQTPFRVFVGKTAKLVTSTIVDLDFYDTQCGFKAFKKEVVKVMLPELTIDRFCFDVEMLYVAKLHGYAFKEVPVVWENREESTVNPVRDGIKFAQDLVRIRNTHKRKKVK